MEGVRLIGGSKAGVCFASVEPLTATVMIGTLYACGFFGNVDLAGFVGIIAGVIILSLPKEEKMIWQDYRKSRREM
ncbi:MAG: hypothetical protein ACLR2O_05945 [Coprococcus sp.]